MLHIVRTNYQTGIWWKGTAQFMNVDDPINHGLLDIWMVFWISSGWLAKNVITCHVYLLDNGQYFLVSYTGIIMSQLEAYYTLLAYFFPKVSCFSANSLPSIKHDISFCPSRLDFLVSRTLPKIPVLFTFLSNACLVLAFCVIFLPWE